VLAREVHQLLGSGHGIRERLLDQRVQAALEHRLPHLHVRRRRHDDGNRLDAVEQRLEGRMRDRLELLGDLGGARRIVVVEAHDVRTSDLLQQPYVVKTKRARADHAYLDRPDSLRHTITPRCEASMNCRNVSTSAICGNSTRARAIPWLTVRSELNTRR